MAQKLCYTNYKVNLSKTQYYEKDICYFAVSLPAYYHFKSLRRIAYVMGNKLSRLFGMYSMPIHP